MLEQALQAEKESLEKEQEALRIQVAEADARLREIEERLAHVNGLLSPSSTTMGAPGLNGSHPALTAADIAFEVLAERNGETMYYKDLAAEVQNGAGIYRAKTPLRSWSRAWSRTTGSCARSARDSTH